MNPLGDCCVVVSLIVCCVLWYVFVCIVCCECCGVRYLSCVVVFVGCVLYFVFCVLCLFVELSVVCVVMLVYAFIFVCSNCEQTQTVQNHVCPQSKNNCLIMGSGATPTRPMPDGNCQ